MRDTRLQGWNVKAVPTKIARQGEDGQPEMVEGWEIAFRCKTTGDIIRYAFGREVRDQIVRELTGGIVLAGGEFPQV